MRDEDKTKEQLIDELIAMRGRVAMLETSEAGHRCLAAKDGVKLGEILVQIGWLTETQLKKALLKQEEAGDNTPLGKILMESGDITTEQLYTALVEQLTQLKKLEAKRKKAEEELKEAQKYAQDIINSSIDMIIAVDNDRRIIEFNEASERAFGYSREEMLGKYVGILYGDPRESSEVNESNKRTGKFTGEIINRRKNGGMFPSLISAAVLRNTKGEPVGFMGISRDITEQKHMEKRLRESEKMASLGCLVAGAAHELNNPISFIYSNIHHLRQYIQNMKTILGKYHKACSSPVSEVSNCISDVEQLKKQLDLDYMVQDLDQLVDDIDEGATRTKRIVEDLKSFSPPDEGKIEDIDIHEDIEKSLNLLVDYYKGRITIHRDYADLPKVKCYAGQISQVFMNILANAFQAIESQGDVWITTQLENDVVIISIKDNGVGIAEDHIGKIFDPFFTTRDVGNGTGLGLTVSYGIIETHKGAILVDSQLGSGTVFSVRIPVDFEARTIHSTPGVSSDPMIAALV